MKLSLSLIIPAYNEASRLGRTLDTVFAYMNQHEPDGEVIVVDDGSTDETVQVAEESFVRGAAGVARRVIAVQPNRGKGHAVKQGFLAAQNGIALFSDADFSTPITETPKVVEPVRRNEYDIVFGSRAVDRSLIGTHQPWRREQGGKLVNLLIRARTGMPFSDTQCGFKAFRMSRFRPLAEASQIERFGFDVELLFLAHRADLRLREQAVRWDHYDGSKLSPARDGLRMFAEVQTIRRNMDKGRYDEAIQQAKTLARNDGAPNDISVKQENSPAALDALADFST